MTHVLDKGVDILRPWVLWVSQPLTILNHPQTKCSVVTTDYRQPAFMNFYYWCIYIQNLNFIYVAISIVQFQLLYLNVRP